MAVSSMSLVCLLLVVFATKCKGDTTLECQGSSEKCICNPVVNVGSQTCKSEGISLLLDLLAEQKGIINSLRERVARLEALIGATESAVTCPAGYQLFKETCYRFSNETKSYNESREICTGEGGRLATVKDEETHNFLAGHVRDTTGAFTWIGLSDVTMDGLWVWEDGTLLVGEGIWGTNEPNGSRRENCAHIYPSKDYRWNDSTCPSSYYYICEFHP